MQVRANWLQVTRVLTQYVAPTLVVLALAVELSGLSFRTVAYDYLLAIVFSVLTIVMIGVCGWVVFLWDIDRLFFRLERKIDAQLPEQTASEEPDGSLLGRAKEMLNNKTQHIRAQAVGAIEKAYWEDINAGGVLAFPQPNIAAAVEQIDKSRRDLLAPLTELVVRAIPMGNAPASIVSRVIFRFVAPDVKLRLYRPLVAFQGHPFRCAPLACVAAIEAIHRGAFSLLCEWPAKLSTARVSAGGTQQLVPCSICHLTLVLRTRRVVGGDP